MRRIQVPSIEIPLVWLLLFLPLVSGCGSDDEPEQAAGFPTLPPLEVGALPSDTPASTPSATPAPSDGADRAADDIALPSSDDDVVVQLARIEPSPWEPALLAQMVPHFSLQRGGYGVFSYPVGPSDDGWYQTAMTPEDVLRFLEILIDEVRFFDLVDGRSGAEPVVFRTPNDGSVPTCPDGKTEEAWGIVYVKTAARDGRLVISQCELNDPQGSDAAQIRELQKILNIVQLWKSGLLREFSDDQKLAAREFLGWWSEIRQSYTPESLVAYGTEARARIPADAPRATWPLNQPLDEAFDAGYGASPVERRYTSPDHVRLIRAARTNLGTLWGPRFWGPLWVDGDGNEHFVGLRPAVPGANQTVIEYEYEVPVRGIGAGR